MHNATPRMSTLFLQLGLDASESGIAQFIQTHQLEAEVALHEAPFWTPAQLQFLTEQIKNDAAWAIVVDQLNEALHADAAQACTKCR